jgi:hypothetical protein
MKRKCKECDDTGYTPWVVTCLDHPPCEGCTSVRSYCSCMKGGEKFDLSYTPEQLKVAKKIRSNKSRATK